MTFRHTCGCVWARPLISVVYFRRALVPAVCRTVSLCLHPPNCTLSLNTPSAFNYCLRVLGSGVAHPVGSTSVACVRVQLVRFNVQNVLHREWSIGRSVEFQSRPHRPALCSSHATHRWPATSSVGIILGVQMACKGVPGRTHGMRRDSDY